ncbi:MAG: glycosyltransferase family 4 protein [Myxococcales bacterium]
MKILVVTLFTATSGSSRVMAFQFLPLLRELGIESDVITIYPDEFFNVQGGIVPASKLVKSLNFGYYLVLGMAQRLKAVIAAGKYDAVFVQRDPFPKLLLKLLQRQNPRIVYEFEDAFESTNPFLKQRSLVHRLLLQWQSGLYKNMVAEASHVIASNALCADEARPVNPNVTVLCEPIDLTRYRELPEKPASDQLVIGWIGSPSTTSFLHFAREPLRALCEKYPNLVLRVVGAGDHLDMPGVRVEKRPWRKETEVADLRSFDVGIMPLNSDPFYRTHLGHKMIQYMAVGIPVVASHTEINATVVEDGVNGYLVKDDAEWVARLTLLLEDEALRGAMGSRGRALVKERFDLLRQAALLGGVIRALVDPQLSAS